MVLGPPMGWKSLPLPLPLPVRMLSRRTSSTLASVWPTLFESGSSTRVASASTSMLSSSVIGQDMHGAMPTTGSLCCEVGVLVF